MWAAFDAHKVIKHERERENALIEGRCLYMYVCETIAQNRGINLPERLSDVFEDAKRHHRCTDCQVKNFLTGTILYFDNQPITASGNVYCCMQSGFLHWCRKTTNSCNFRSVDTHGFATCHFSGLVIANPSMSHLPTEDKEYYVSRAKKDTIMNHERISDNSVLPYELTDDYKLFFGAKLDTDLVEQTLNETEFMNEASKIIASVLNFRMLRELDPSLIIDERIQQIIDNGTFTFKVAQNCLHLFKILHGTSHYRKAFYQTFILTYTRCMYRGGYVLPLDNHDLKQNIDKELYAEVLDVRFLVVPAHPIVTALYPHDNKILKELITRQVNVRKNMVTNKSLKKTRDLTNNIKYAFNALVAEYNDQISVCLKKLSTFYPPNDLTEFHV